MHAKPLNKHALKTRETRDLLLKAAEKIFIRDGYESAELGEIATLAGRTKGAIYAHFKNKEDLFIALFERRTEIWSSRFSTMIASSKGNEHVQVLREFLISILEDNGLLLLLLEFKLYAARNPKSKKHLKNVYRGLYPTDEQIYIDLFGAPSPGDHSIERSSAIKLVLPLLSALAVERQFAPQLLQSGMMKKVALRLFDALME